MMLGGVQPTGSESRPVLTMVFLVLCEKLLQWLV